MPPSFRCRFARVRIHPGRAPKGFIPVCQIVGRSSEQMVYSRPASLTVESSRVTFPAEDSALLSTEPAAGGESVFAESTLLWRSVCSAFLCSQYRRARRSAALLPDDDFFIKAALLQADAGRLPVDAAGVRNLQIEVTYPDGWPGEEIRPFSFRNDYSGGFDTNVTYYPQYAVSLTIPQAETVPAG